MQVQKITRLSIYGSNAEFCEMATNVWIVVYHDIDFESRSSVYAGTKICTSEQEAYEECRIWLDKREEYNEKSEQL